MLIAKQRARLASLEQQKQEALCALPPSDLQQQREQIQQQRQQIQLQLLQLQPQAEQQQQEQQQQQLQPALAGSNEDMDTDSSRPQAEGHADGGFTAQPLRSHAATSSQEIGGQRGSNPDDGVWL